MKKQYSFLSKWQIAAPVEEVWDLIYHSENWSSWWEDVKEVKELATGSDDGLGSVRRYRLASPMLYTLEFDLLLTDFRKYELLKGEASGQLQGSGAWHFYQQGAICVVECHWNVSTTIAWMNAVAFLLAPVFRYNHDRVMKRGEASIKRKLALKQDSSFHPS